MAGIRIEERWVDTTTRDRELEALLESTIAKPTDDGLLELLRYGATLALDKLDVDDLDEEDDGELGVFARGAAPTRDGLVRVLGPLPRAVYDLAYERETIEPGEDWSEKHQAMFWRAVAEAFRDRYSDALLNLTADALEKAIPWYEAHAPIQAAHMLGLRARVLGYASYSENHVLPAVDRARAILTRASANPEIEYEIILQLCEAIRRMRGLRHWPHTRELFELGMRGLELVEELGEPPQRAELYGSVADAIVNRPETIELDVAALARRLGTSAEPFAVAEAAWQRALELEDGMFFGTFREDHLTSHKEVYTQGLVTIALRRGDAPRARKLYDGLPTPVTVYERFNRTKAFLVLLRQNGAPRDVQADALASRLRSDLLEGPRFEEWDHEQAARYLIYARLRLWNLGYRESTTELVHAICEKENLPKSDPEPSTAIDEAASFDEDDMEAEEEPATDPVDEPLEERAYRIAMATAERWLRETRMTLLFAARASVHDLAHATLHLSVNVPEYALDDLLADPSIATQLALLDARLREALPAFHVEKKLTSHALDTGVPPDTSLARALSFANSPGLLARFGLERNATWSEMGVDDRRVKRELAAQRSRRIRLEWE